VTRSHHPDEEHQQQLTDQADPDLVEQRARLRARTRSTGRRLAVEGRSGRQVVPEPETAAATDISSWDFVWEVADEVAPVDQDYDRYSSYDVAQHGPKPVPSWVVTDLSALDTPLGAIKSGKEADVSLLERALPNESCLLAVKMYRTARTGMFHRDSGYTEGRRIRRSREGRAMSARTTFGRDLLAGKWAQAEFQALTQMWEAGAHVPYPVQLLGSEIMMEFIGDEDGTAAPRLVSYVPASSEDSVAVFTRLWHGLVEDLEIMAGLGFAHGDLSAYNILVHENRCVLIDLPQVIDLVINPQGMAYLKRDVDNIASFFARKGVVDADPDDLAMRLAISAGLT